MFRAKSRIFSGSKAIMDIYGNIKEIASRKGLSIYELEKRANLSGNSISKWKNHSPSIDNLLKVSKVLKVSINRLMR